jgi:branched-chain amino acid transport system ATP-binding protein
VTVLLVEHAMALVLGICDRIAVLDFGRRIAVGTPAEIKANPVVIEAYLGTPDDEAYDA